MDMDEVVFCARCHAEAVDKEGAVCGYCIAAADLRTELEQVRAELAAERLSLHDQIVEDDDRITRLRAELERVTKERDEIAKLHYKEQSRRKIAERAADFWHGKCLEARAGAAKEFYGEAGAMYIYDGNHLVPFWCPHCGRNRERKADGVVCVRCGK